jgi:hypothetical protein
MGRKAMSSWFYLILDTAIRQCRATMKIIPISSNISLRSAQAEMFVYRIVKRPTLKIGDTKTKVKLWFTI